MYSFEGPDPENPIEPTLDRIVRFQDAIALRPFCEPIGVVVKRVLGKLGSDAEVAFQVGDAVIGLKTTLGPDCKFDAQDGDITFPGFEPISDFQFEIEGVFSGKSEIGLPRPNPTDPNVPVPSTAPYADGFLRMDQASPRKPSDFGFIEANWTERAESLPLAKLTRLQNEPSDPLRDRRIAEHENNLGGLQFTMRMLERYTGTIHLDVQIDPADSPVLASFQDFDRFKWYAEFFDFDSDCQSGMVWGTLAPS